MRRLFCAMLILAIITLLAGCGTRAETDVALFAANVGKGDALVLRVGDYRCLIDSGRSWALGRVCRALAYMGVTDGVDAVFITHTDDDHAGGLEWLAGGVLPRELAVGQWYAPAKYTGVKAKKHPVALAASSRDQSVNWLQRGDVIPLGDTGATLRVLAPASQFEDKDNNNSLVMLLECDQGKMLFTGDMELPEEAELLSFGDDLRCDVLKVANHADDDTTSAAFAKACAAELAVISTDSAEKPETPDPGVVSRLQAAGGRVVVTQDAGLGILVTLKGGVASAEYVDFGAPELSGLVIEEADAASDRVTLRNAGATAADLGYAYLYIEKSDKLFVFPAGTTLEPGATLTVGARDAEGGYDLLWDEKKVLRKKKSDTVCLYDGWGRLLDRAESGM